jgi:transcriptional regulator with XRE-family HTH domain
MQLSLPERVTLAVRAEARRKGVSQRWIAERLGLSQAQVWERMRGVVEWRTGELDRLAAALEVDVAALLPSEDPVA